MGHTKRFVAPFVVAIAITVIASSQVVTRAREHGPDDYSAAPVELTVPHDDTATAEPTARPKPKRKQKSSSVPLTRPSSGGSSAPAPKPVSVPAGYASAPSTAAADKTALLIGINKAPGSTPLEGSITDVKNMKSALLDFGWKESNIEVLTEGKASRSGILNALSRFSSRSKSNGIAVFLLATHSGQSGGDLTFATGGGGRISRHELADRLGRVRGRLWSMLPTCYSGGYALPGIVGKNRIAVFSSSKDDLTWQVGGAGSWLVLYMVKYAMVDRNPPYTSVEDAFASAKKGLLERHAGRAPIMNDKISGDLVLGKSKKAGLLAKVVSKPSPKPTPYVVPTPTPVPANTSRPCGLLGALFGCRR